MPTRILVQCSSVVDRKAVRREVRDGVEHIIISSHTLPDNIVMNEGLYPADEIAKSYATLERTLAPIEHPKNADGQYISAADPTAIHNYYAGAFNENVRRENGRVSLDKVINVPEAMRSERGRRLLDRVHELETGADPRPVHTSTGVLLEVEKLAAPLVNAAGKPYTWVAKNMVFDHDAILLDTVAAAQPHEGVGMAVNRSGEKIDVQRVAINAAPVGETPPDELSYDELSGLLRAALTAAPYAADWVERIYPSRVVYAQDDSLFEVPYTLSGGAVTISGIPVPVELDERFVRKTNQKGNTMKASLLAKLAAAGVTVNADATDDEILAKYNELVAPKTNDSGSAGASDDMAVVVANALAPLVERLGGLEAKLNAKGDAELAELAAVVVNSGKYTGIGLDDAKKLGVDVLKTMAANCQTSHGLPLHANSGAGGSGEQSYDMPE